jgi:hypothetical protein
MKSEFLTREQLASIFHCTTRTIHNYVKSGAIPAPARVGRRQLWQLSDLIAFVKEQQAELEPASRPKAGEVLAAAQRPDISVKPATSSEGPT